jgi:hypothetical protein
MRHLAERAVIEPEPHAEPEGARVGADARRGEPPPPPPLPAPLTGEARAAGDDRVPLLTRVRRFLRDHHRKIWWVHSLYALGLGVFVASFAQKGLERARLLAVSLGLAWLLAIVVFRLFGSGKKQRDLSLSPAQDRVSFFVMTYVLKNLYQGMLFFLLPFYWKSTTFDAPNAFFVVALGVCALLSTLDIVFDRVLMRFQTLASVFHGFTLFACLNLLVPAIFPDVRVTVALLSAAGVSIVAFWTFHAPSWTYREPKWLGMLGAAVLAGLGLAWLARPLVPPVPLYLARAAVGPARLADGASAILADGRLKLEVKTLHVSTIADLVAVTEVVVPGERGGRLHHVWRQNGIEIMRTEPKEATVSDDHRVKLQSTLAGKSLPKQLAGEWSVDVETEDGQLVGRTKFSVIE